MRNTWSEPFSDRRDAGSALARRLRHLGRDVVVLGLPRGGVPVAAEVARVLGAPLDVIVVRKLGVPYQPELAMGAVGEDDVLVRNARVLALAGVSETGLAQAADRERAEVVDRARRFRGDRPRRDLHGRTAVLVDDGIATGSTMRAAVAVARAQGAARIVVAAPACAPEAAAALRGDVDELVCLTEPEEFLAVGQFYSDFRPTEDAEVVELLRMSAPPESAAERANAAADPPPRDEEVTVTAGGVRLGGHLTVPAEAHGLVVFVHGSGSSRHSPRNRHVAAVLQRAGLATLLFDLLAVEEEADRANVFDIELLAGRLTEVTRWVREQPGCATVPIGWFGASTGAGAALWTAAEPGADVAAVVSRGGRPDLAGPRLPAVTAPTLLIVGGRDDVVLDLNRQAQARLRCPNRLAVVPGATHLFEEPGTLDRAADLAAEWFAGHLATPPAAAPPPLVRPGA